MAKRNGVESEAGSARRVILAAVVSVRPGRAILSATTTSRTTMAAIQEPLENGNGDAGPVQAGGGVLEMHPNGYGFLRDRPPITCGS